MKTLNLEDTLNMIVTVGLLTYFLMDIEYWSLIASLFFTDPFLVFNFWLEWR